MQRPVIPPGAPFGQDVWTGILHLLFDYGDLRNDDDVVVVYTPDLREPVSWVCLALQNAGANYSTVAMNPLTDSTFPSRLRAKIAASRATPGKCIALVFESETMSHNHVFREVFRGYTADQRRIVRCINTGSDLFAIGLSPRPDEVSRRNADLLHFLRNERRIEISTAAGTRLEIELDPRRFDWISNRGVSEGGRMIALPAGEIATFPARIDGQLVADFAINVNYRFDGDVRLQSNPVVVQIRDNQLTSFSCKEKRIAEQLERFFAMNNAKRVGELGFGTHPAMLAALPENTHLNERRRGVHIGFGQHNQADQLAGYVAQVHVDLIASGGKVRLSGGEEIDLESVPVVNATHPHLMKSVDLFSPADTPPDIAPVYCCGLPN